MNYLKKLLKKKAISNQSLEQRHKALLKLKNDNFVVKL